MDKGHVMVKRVSTASLDRYPFLACVFGVDIGTRGSYMSRRRRGSNVNALIRYFAITGRSASGIGKRAPVCLTLVYVYAANRIC